MSLIGPRELDFARDTGHVHDSNDLWDTRARAEAAIGLLVEQRVHAAADPFGGIEKFSRAQVAELRRDALAAVHGLVCRPDSDPRVADLRAIGRGEK